MKYLLLFFLAALGTSQESTIDRRDNKKYEVRNIGKQNWLMENLRFINKDSAWDPDYYEAFGNYYRKAELVTICPDGYHVPSLGEWKTLIEEIPGKINTRQGKLIPATSLVNYGLQLGGMGRQDTVLLNRVMGYYWTSSDTLMPYYKQPDAGMQKHLIGIHIWNSGEQDSINIEPTYILAKNYESWIGMNCKCIE